MNPYPTLFSACSVNAMRLQNRVLMAPVATNLCDPDGGVNESLVAYYAERARGGVGLVIVENSNVDFPLGMNGAVQLRIDKDRFLPGLGLLREAMYDANPDCRVALQINHPGGQTKSSRTENQQPVGPSNVPTSPKGEVPRPLTLAEIDHLVGQFALAAERVKRAGFDAVEIHGGFCYLLAQFLSPFHNRRTDDYGGSIANRARFPERIIRAVREKVGPAFPILFRLNADEFIDGGTTLEHSGKTAEILEKATVDMFHVTAGSGYAVARHIEPMSYPQGWKSYLAAAIKKEVNVPVVAVGNIREPAVAEDILARGDADCVALGRPLIADPHWVEKAKKNKPFNRCISCNVCAGRRLALDLSIRCSVNPLVGCELKESGRRPPRKKLTVLVAGGGPAGMKAAVEAARDGHSVILADRNSQLGGRGLIAAIPPGKDKVLWLVEDLSRQVRELVGDIRLNTVVDMNFIRKIKPDYSIVAVGSDSAIPQVLVDIKAETTMLAEEVLRAALVPSGKAIGVVGGGAVGCECAEYLAKNGNTVTLYEMRDAVAVDTDPITRSDLLANLEACGVALKTGHCMRGYAEGVLTCTLGNEERNDPLDMLVFAGGIRIRPSLLDELIALNHPHCVIGDCRAPGRFVDAARQAHTAVEQLRNTC